MRNLLVVDFDYFFVNPLEGGIFGDDTFWLYDWGHRESELYRTIIWPSRAAAFWANDRQLPGVVIPDNWWGRFNISPDATCTVSDSNMYSGVMEPGDSYDHVWLFDAHHDLYRIETQEEADKWAAAGGPISCEDWMFAHHQRGSKLHWRWPQWHKAAKGMRDSIPKFVNCDARKDDMGKLDMKFDAVSVCRSGCWVPPWCDEDFKHFVESCPVMEIVEVEDGSLEQREWREAAELTALARSNYTADPAGLIPISMADIARFAKIANTDL
jgi:hypothetical protein